MLVPLSRINYLPCSIELFIFRAARVFAFRFVSLVRRLEGRNCFPHLSKLGDKLGACPESSVNCSMKGRKDKEWKEGREATGSETTVQEGRQCHHLPVFAPGDVVLNSCNHL